MKTVPARLQIKLRDNQTFKALLWIKKSFKSIEFDLVKQDLLSPTHSPLHWLS